MKFSNKIIKNNTFLLLTIFPSTQAFNQENNSQINRDDNSIYDKLSLPAKDINTLIADKKSINPEVESILESLNKKDINTFSLKAFSDVYIEDTFSGRIIKLIEHKKAMTTDYLMGGIKFYLKSFKNLATVQQSNATDLGENITQENVVVASSLMIQTFRKPLVREAGLFQDFLDLKDLEKKHENENLSSYDEKEHEKLINDKGYNTYKYQEFLTRLVSKIEKNVKEINTVSELRNKIIETIKNDNSLSRDFERLPSEFRKDQIIDRLKRAVYDAYEKDFNFSKPIMEVPLTRTGLVYNNAKDNEANLNTKDHEYWVIVNDYSHSYAMYSFLIDVLKTNATDIYKNSKEGKELIERLPEFKLNFSMMRFVYKFNLLNLPEYQDKKEIRAHAIYPLKKLTNRCFSILNLEDNLKNQSIGINLKETFSSDFFKDLKLLSVDNASELFYFTLNDVLISNEKEPISFKSAECLYLYCQVINMNNNNFFEGKHSNYTKNNEVIDIRKLLSANLEQGHSLLANPNDDFSNYNIKISNNLIYKKPKLASNPY